MKTEAKITYLPEMQRLLPQSTDAEQGLLCSFMLAPMEVGAVCAERRITPEHLHIPAHAIIFACLFERWTAGHAIDFITVTQALRDKGTLDQCGGAAFITGLFTFIPTAANTTYYAEILEEKRKLRELIKHGTEFVARAYEPLEDAHALFEEAANKIVGIGAQMVATKPKTPKDMAMEACDRANDRIDKRGLQDFTMKTGIPKLDEGMSGIRLGDYILISGKEKSGKSSLAFQILENVVFEQKKRAFAASLEMKTPEITDRMLASMGRVNFTNILNGWMNEGEQRQFMAAADRLSVGTFQIRDDVQTLPQIVAVFRQYKAAHADFELGVVDYLQLIDADKGGRDDSREQVISHISRTMRRVASELNIAILMLVQLNEDGQVRESRAPGMDCTAHIRIEPGKEEGQKWARIVYQRNGPSNVGIPLSHIGQFLRFEPAAFDEEAPRSSPQKKQRRNWQQD
jgi:replicative DNA helicase